MLILRTGVPGAGKTLNTIKDLDEEYGRNPKKPDEELRTIYYYNIPELDNNKLKANWVPFDDPENWYNYPDGSIFVIDEAQEIFPNDGKRERPEKITRMERHRHQGHDIVLITQHPTLISPHVRKLVGKHIHIHRPFGGHRLKKYVYEFCIDEPQRYANFSLAQIFKIKLDKKYFGVYKSATQHTHKFKLPKQYIIIGGGIVFIIVCVVIGIKSLSDMNSKLVVEDNEQQVITDTNQPRSEASKVLTGDIVNQTPIKTTEQYITENLPRIKDIPSSAPRYDELNKPVVMPKPTCLMSTDENKVAQVKQNKFKLGYKDNQWFVCQCYTQQGTRLDISANACYDYVENGYFDDTSTPNQPISALQSAVSPTSRVAEREQVTRLY